jgi:hypothetical protein
MSETNPEVPLGMEDRIPFQPSQVKSKSHYDRRSVGQSVFESSPFWVPRQDFLLLPDNCGFVDVRRPL